MYWYARFNPREDITVFELSKCLEMFGDLSKEVVMHDLFYKRMTNQPEPYLKHVQFSNKKGFTVVK